MAFETTVKVRFGDVDNAGIAYYPTIFHMCHVAFEELFERHIGVSYHLVLGREKLGFPAVHVEADFQSPLVFGEQVGISVTVPQRGEKSVTFRYAFRAADGRPLAAISIKTAVVDMRTFKATPLPAPYRDAFDKLKPA